MKIKLGTKQELSLDLSTATGMLFVGSEGTGKTKTINDILKQVKNSRERVSVLYLDQHYADFANVREICDGLLNETNSLNEEELKSLLETVKEQNKFRTELMIQAKVNTLDRLCGREIRTYTIAGVEYMPDDIVSTYENGSQKFKLAYKYYDDEVVGRKSFFVEETSINKYKPARLILCFDEFYASDNPETTPTIVHDIVREIVLHGRVGWQNVIITTQRLYQHKEYVDLYNVMMVTMFFHSGLSDEDFEVLFNKKPKGYERRFDVTADVLGEIRHIKLF